MLPGQQTRTLTGWGDFITEKHEKLKGKLEALKNVARFCRSMEHSIQNLMGSSISNVIEHCIQNVLFSAFYYT